MSTNPTDLMSGLDRSQEENMKLAARLFAAAHPTAVYGEPVVSGPYTIITASEVSAGGGFGHGRGIGPSPARADGEAPSAQSLGGGGGGGGGSTGRPVAIIVIGPDGVKIRPVVDATKIALAGVTAWGTMLFMLLRWRRQARFRPPFSAEAFRRGGPPRLLQTVLGTLLSQGRQRRRR